MEELEDNVCEEKVFKILFQKYSQDLYRFLYYKFGEDNNPGDLVQEAFVKLWNNCSKVTTEKAKSFLYTVATNQALNEISKRKTALNYSKGRFRQYDSETPQYVLEESEYMERLKNALEDLTEEQRVTFLLNRVEGKKHQEIADMLGISRKAVEKRIYTALKKLQEKLGEP